MNSLERIGEDEGIETSRPQKFLILFLVGFALIFLGITILMIAALFYGPSTINFGCIIFIGPFPIVIGVGPDATLMVLFSIIFAILSIVIFLILRKEIVKINA
jgi:uncharacterized membrane protein